MTGDKNFGSREGLSACHYVAFVSHLRKNNCWGSKIKRSIFALRFKCPCKAYYHRVTGNQIQIMINENHTGGSRKRYSVHMETSNKKYSVTKVFSTV